MHVDIHVEQGERERERERERQHDRGDRDRPSLQAAGVHQHCLWSRGAWADKTRPLLRLDWASFGGLYKNSSLVG